MLRYRTPLSLNPWANRFKLLFLSAISFGMLIQISFAGEVVTMTFPMWAESACSQSENWIPSTGHETILEQFPVYEVEFSSFLSHKISVVRSFSEALALRKLAHTAELKFFSEYWISRSLYEAGLTEISLQGFNSLVSREPTLETLGIQIASLQCINLIHSQYPTLGLTPVSEKQLTSFFRKTFQPFESKSMFETLIESALQVLMENIENKTNLLETQYLVRQLSGFEDYDNFVKGLLAVRQSKHSEAVRHFQSLLLKASLPRSIELHREQIKLFLAREYYAMGFYQKSIENFKSISKNSNDLNQVLSELAWAQLMAGNYPETVGIGIGVQSGWMKNTFTPEALMVSAMALNEICRFPESLRMIELYRKEYRDSFHWLKQANENQDLKEPNPEFNQNTYYSKAVSLIKTPKKLSQIPKKITGEWIKSPIFISHQEEINLIFSEKILIKSLGKSGKKEQKDQAIRLLKMAKRLRKQYRLAEIRMKPGEDATKGLRNEFNRLRTEVTHYERLERAAPVWRAILAHYQTGVVTRQKYLVSGIEKEISLINQRLFQQLNEISENNELIEVEIYNGASKDIVRKNAQNNVNQINDTKENSKRFIATSGDIYNWGTSKSGLSGEEEIWEEELDSMKANLANHCPTPRAKK